MKNNIEKVNVTDPEVLQQWGSINKDIVYTYGDFQTEYFAKELFESTHTEIYDY